MVSICDSSFSVIHVRVQFVTGCGVRLLHTCSHFFMASRGLTDCASDFLRIVWQLEDGYFTDDVCMEMCYCDS